MLGNMVAMADGIGGTAPCETPAHPPPAVAWNDRDAHPDPHRAAAPARKHMPAAFSPSLKGAALARARTASISSAPWKPSPTELGGCGVPPRHRGRHSTRTVCGQKLWGGGCTPDSHELAQQTTMSLESGERLNGFFYEEVVTEDLYLKMELKKIGFNGESKFQVTARVVLGKIA
jgi:hypothetical protein